MHVFVQSTVLGCIMLNDILALADLGQSLLPTVVEQCPHVRMTEHVNNGQLNTQ